MPDILDAHLHVNSLNNSLNPEHSYFLNAANEKDWNIVIEFTVRYEKVKGFLGVHPWFINSISDNWETALTKILIEHPNIGVGEIGIDKVTNPLCFNKQVELFKKQLKIAVQLNRPVVIHCVKAFDSLFQIFKEMGISKIHGILHRFEGNMDIMERLLKYGLYISFYYSVHKRDKIKEALLNCPSERMFLESDSGNGQDDEALNEHYKNTAGLLGMNYNQLIKVINQNGKVFADKAFTR